MRPQALPESIKSLGLGNAGLYWLQRARERRVNDQRLLRVQAREASYPLVYRANTSDRSVFAQIFLGNEYADVSDLGNVGLVIDCGANAGFSTAYFLSRFPECRVIAIEPDSETFKVLRLNLKPYGNRVQMVNAAVWSHQTGLRLVHGYRDGEAWTAQVREVSADEDPDVDAVDLGTLIDGSGYERLSLLKVDIEGAEAVLFNDAPWIDLVDNIVIEIHDDSSFGDARAVFRRAIADQSFVVKEVGERTICKRGPTG
jgi:FkbM family methyltransferase